MVTWRDRGFVPDSDDEGEVEEESQVLGSVPGRGEKKKLPREDNGLNDFDALSHEYEGFSPAGGPVREASDVEIYGGGEGNLRIATTVEPGTSVLSLMTNRVERPEKSSLEISNVRGEIDTLDMTRDDDEDTYSCLGMEEHLEAVSAAVPPPTRLQTEIEHTRISKETAVETSSINLGRSSQSSDVLSTPPTVLSSPGSSFPIGQPRSVQNSPVQVQVVISEALVSGQPATRKSPARVVLDPVPAPRLNHTLRKRNPIQLHPYLLEGERYRQALKSRGIKPIRVEEPEGQEAEAASSDSQDQEFEAGDNSQPNVSNEVSQDASSTQLQDISASYLPVEDDQPSPILQDTALPFSDDDEFPDLNALLRRKPTGTVYNGHKRRKIDNTTVKEATSRLFAVLKSVEPMAPRAVTSLPKLNLARSTDQVESRNGTSIFDVPSSPSHSIRSRPSRPTSPETPGFRFPQGFSVERGQNTPISTETSRQVVVEVSDDSDSGPRSYRRRNKTSSNTSRSSSVTFDEDNSAQLRTVQRKIRGVLPASWLRLDHQNQTDGPALQVKRARQYHVPPSTRNIARPGVARRKSLSRSRSTSIAPVDISDDSEASSPGENLSESREVRPAQSDFRQRLGDITALQESWEVEEDNRVDAMLPSAGILRNNYSKKPHNKRQKKHEVTADGLSPSLLSKPVCSRHTWQPRITEHLSNKPSAKDERGVPRRRKVPKLGILDAPKLAGGSQGSTPRFLRIANRQARSRRDKARHSPSKKIIKLHTWRDTEEVQSVLRNWREGTILPTADFPSPFVLPDIRSEGRNGGDIRQRHRTLPAPVLKPLKIISSEKEKPTGTGSRLKFLKSVVRQTKLPSMPSTPSVYAQAAVREPKPPQPRSLAQLKAKPRPPWAPSNKSRVAPKPAQLEILESELPSRHRRAAFHSDLSLLDRLYDQQRLVPSKESNLQLERFLASYDDDELVNNPVSTLKVGRGKVKSRNLTTRKPRKRTPKRLDLVSTEYQPADNPTPDQGDCMIPAGGPNTFILFTGLGPYGVSYTPNFGVIPLPVGTYFHDSTLIGCGEFSKALKTAVRRSYDLDVGSTTFHSAERSLRWGVWSDTVSSEISLEFEWIAQTLEQLSFSGDASRDDGTLHLRPATRAKRLLTFVVNYFADFLSFADPVDRNSFARRSTQVLRNLCERLSLVSPRTSRSLDHSAKFVMQTASLSALLAYQIFRIVQSGIVESSIKAETEDLLRLAAQGLIRILLFYDIKLVRSFYEENQRASKRGEGIREDNFLIEAWVVAIQTLSQPGLEKDMFWSAINDHLGLEKLQNVSNVQVFEQVWMKVIFILPLFEFDEYGVLEVGRRFKALDDNWTLVRGLVNRTFDIYKSNPSKQPATANEYLRVVFSRCHHLITGWGWKKCESIIGVLFDFFAGQGLAHLYKEEASGSPSFLERLDQEPSLEIEPGDKCFHILLKIIGVGLKAMSNIYAERRMRNIVFRWMPNHGRQYPKEEAVRCQDLESLRNHHNLLCTLYWASPPSSRPSVNAIRDLVDPETSHREACHISLRAWSNLMKYQLSSKEPAASLEPFMTWHSGLTSQMIRQHGLARTEAQAQLAAASTKIGTAIMPGLLEMTISQNQQQVEAILVDALVTIRSAMLRARSTDLAMALLGKASTADVFYMFDAKKLRQNKVVAQAVAVVQEYTRICSRPAKSGASQSGNDDSQDFGDWSVFEDLVSQQDGKEAAQRLSDIVYEPLVRLLSNCFGSDLMPDETFLLAVVDVWTSVAQFLVREGLKQWNNFIGTYGRESWSSLRSTEQTRKFTAYFMSKVMETDVTSYEANKSFFLSFWMSSLVERDSMLKFQHRFTNVLLNQDSKNPLLRNLPFWVSNGLNGYAITALEFRERRLSLISCVLANMRDSIQAIGRYSTTEATNARHGYTELLKSLMSSMKTNYEELRQGSSYHGSYVEFVQKIVEFLQQHTADICSVDKYFTDSSAFPLPATDPTYVVGRLKHFAPKLAETKIHKRFASFLLSVSDRAAAEHQQDYLTGQIYTAMSNTFESGDINKPSLRAFLVQAIFPAYVEVAMDSTTGWIFARPLLKALNHMFNTFLTDIDSNNPACVQSSFSILDHALDSFRNSADLIIPQSGLLEQPAVLNTLASFYSSITAMLNPLDYLHRRSGRGGHAVRCVGFFTALGVFISNLLEGNQDEAVSPYVDAPDFPALPALFPEVRQYSSQELRAALKAKWSRRGDEYFVVLKGSPVQVEVEIGRFEEEKEGLLDAIKEYNDLAGEMGFLQNRPPARRNRGIRILGDLLF